jgi:hypothetical protein
MTNSLELNARAALCRQLARREPNSKILWLAEAERWSRLTVEPCAVGATPQGEAAGTWRWIVPRKRKPSGLEMTGLQSEFPNAAGGDEFERLLSDIPPSAHC